MIINSILDTDWYKVTMGNLAFKRFPNLIVHYDLFNRSTQIDLRRHINPDELKEELTHLLNLRLTLDEANFIYEQGILSKGYIDYLLANLGTNQVNLDLNIKDGPTDMQLGFQGSWPLSIIYEVPIMAIINELYTRSLMEGIPEDLKEAMKIESDQRLFRKARILNENPGIKFAEMGSRRRFSYGNQLEVLMYLKDTCPENLLGTSNIFMAKELDLKPIGTTAHEWYMVIAALSYEEGNRNSLLRDAHGEAMQIWSEEYPSQKVVLTDTFTTAQFYRDWVGHLLDHFKIGRQDSGDPCIMADTTIDHLKEHGKDPLKDGYGVLFSDSLNIDKILNLFKLYSPQIGTSFGWGTDLSNDKGIVPLQIVIKATGIGVRKHQLFVPTVKLSNSVGKAMCSSEAVKADYIVAFVNKEDITDG